MTKNSNKTIWFDMDGVLSLYEPEAYVGVNPTFRTQPNYFRNLAPDALMMEVFSVLTARNAPGIDVHVISKCQSSVQKFMEESSDKRLWLHEHVSGDSPVFESHFVGEKESKADKAMAVLGRPLTKHDVLIDDYNANLQDWMDKGGCALKYGVGDQYTAPSYCIPFQSMDWEGVCAFIEVVLDESIRTY